MKNYFKEHETNPFRGIEFEQKMKAFAKSKLRTKEILTERETGPNEVIADQTAYDSEPFIKLYCIQLAVLNSLTITGLKILTHIMQNLEMNNELVRIVPPRIKREYELTQQGYYNGLKNLLENNIIARAKDDDKRTYFINPNILWNGKRETLIKNFKNIKKQTPMQVHRRRAA
ncbi:MAG: Rep [Microviridae sp.]|nr:MAG: Rep [Microviridae sp.]